MSPYPLRVTGAGPSDMWRGDRDKTPTILLVGVATVTVGGPGCRLVEDPTSPLRFAYVGDGVPRQTKGCAGQRWIVLTGEAEGFTATVRALYGANVRIEYQDAGRDLSPA